MLISVVYMSNAAESFTDDGLADMLHEARLRNDALGVTGLLVAKGGRFMQLLEGPEWSVDDRYAVISKDPRHTDVRALIREEIPARRFDGWSMAFAPLADADVRDEPGFSPFLGGADEFAPAFDRTSAAWLFRWFRDRELHDI